MGDASSHSGSHSVAACISNCLIQWEMRLVRSVGTRKETIHEAREIMQEESQGDLLIMPRVLWKLSMNDTSGSYNAPCALETVNE